MKKIIQKILVFSTCLLLGMQAPALHAFAITAEERLAANRQITVESNQIPNWPQGPTVGAQSAILIDADSGAILYEKNIHAQEFPASTTKILTCLIAYEQCDLSEKVKFSHSAVFDTPRDSNNIAIDEGEVLTVDECLQAILIRSANECAFAIAEHMSGTTWQDFGETMNQRAQELGCVDSHFVNPNGLPDDDHYTSAYDLAQIGRAFFAQDYLCEITRSTRLHIYPSEKQKDEIVENNAMQLVEGKPYAYEYLVGCKTGYTDAARSCLISCAEKDGLRLICVVMRDESPYQYEDTLALYNYGFSHFSKIPAAESESRFRMGSTSFNLSANAVFGSTKPMLSINQTSMVLIPDTLDFGALDASISYDTEDASQVAMITYSYEGHFLGKASLDFAKLGHNAYDFNSEGGKPESMTASDTTITEKTDDDTPVIFVNVLKLVIIIVVCLLLLLAIVLSIRSSLRFYAQHPNSRRAWKRNKRRERRKNRHYLRQERRSGVTKPSVGTRPPIGPGGRPSGNGQVSASGRQVNPMPGRQNNGNQSTGNVRSENAGAGAQFSASNRPAGVRPSYHSMMQQFAQQYAEAEEGPEMMEEPMGIYEETNASNSNSNRNSNSNPNTTK